MAWEKELEFARSVAMHAGELALGHQQRGVHPETKADQSPVTVADKESERLIVERIGQSFPDDGVLGEEGSASQGRSGRRWIIDPIDGTRDFVRGLPFWSVLIGLEAGDEVVAGVCHFPGQKETYSAAKGTGAWRNGTPIGASAIGDVSQALLCVNGLDTFARQPRGHEVIDWIGRFWAVRSMGGCGDAALLASGRAEVWLEPTAKAWDLAPFKILFEEAGVRLRNFDGGSSIYGGNCIAYTAALEPALGDLLGLLNG